VRFDLARVRSRVVDVDIREFPAGLSPTVKGTCTEIRRLPGDTEGVVGHAP